MDDEPVMLYERHGTCNRCGECCGFPRATDGGQINPWPLDLATSRNNIDEASLLLDSFFMFIPHPHGEKRPFQLRVGDYVFNYRWDDEKGLVRVSGNIMCPFLLPGKTERLCGLYGTAYHQFWVQNCEIAPPHMIPEDQLREWQKNFPSCSYWFSGRKRKDLQE